MGRSIPSFRILIEIEKSRWFYFRKTLNNNKEDKNASNKLFYIPKVYCHCLSYLSKPLIIESVILVILFHNFKTLITMLESPLLPLSPKVSKSKDYKVEQKTIETLVDTQQQQQHPQQKIQVKDIEEEKEKEAAEKYSTSNKIIEEWSKFIDCLSEEDKNTFIFMINSCYNNYYNSIEANIKGNFADTSCLTRTLSLYMALILDQQKQINLIKSNQRFLDQFV